MSGSSVISRLRALSGRIAEHANSTFRLGVLRALAVASTHYIMDLQRVSSGYMVPNDASPDTASAIMDDANATVEGFATVLAAKLEADILMGLGRPAYPFSGSPRSHLSRVDSSHLLEFLSFTIAPLWT